MKASTLNDILPVAEDEKFGIGSFSPRYTLLIEPVLKAANDLASPLIVQISQKEFDRFYNNAAEFAEEFYRVLEAEEITVPVVLHLDHTKDVSVIEEAIAAGFTSVMIDASDQPFDANVKVTQEVVKLAHAKNVSVEAELGKIGTTDFIETETDEELYTDPSEAADFVEKTHVDALAVSVGTAHGVYKVKAPKVDCERLRAIRALTDVPLVLHGGSGVPPEMVKEAIQTAHITKVNIATDLELAFLAAIGREKSLTDAESKALPAEMIEKGRKAVYAAVQEKIKHYLGSDQKAARF
ncbi:class II fructose-bisphosphate aldolase [Listeria costaricensis]|uniref:class II fructose-bisphosphate aldolase n=1 Tax=Listeria costaricensis TaxID=2026604 RepID=UPI000C06B6FA|nr:class II fructose-bisphosphate aldolase [Listeria costaricensis]